MRDNFSGSIAALPTPFRNGELDLGDLCGPGGLCGLIEFHRKHGTSGVVSTGTSGEASTLTEGEFRRVTHCVVEAAAGELRVIAGIGTNCTRTSVERARFAEHAGADGLLAITPYYNRPSPEGLFRHFSAIADAVSLPIVLYNVPSRTGVDLTPDIVKRLAQTHTHIVAIKQASRSIARVRELVELECVDVLAGEDDLLLEFMQVGAVGVIGVVANIVPERVARLVDLAGRSATSSESEVLDTARQLADELAPLVRALFLEVNPVPLKAALAAMGLCESEVRLPLAPLLPENRKELEQVLATLDLLRSDSVVRSVALTEEVPSPPNLHHPQLR